MKNDKNSSILKIIGAISGAFLFVIIASTSISFTQNAAAHDIITDKTITTNGIIGLDSISGGNNYTAFNEEDMENIKQYLIENNLWNTAVEKSNEIQLEFYKNLSKKLEETSIEDLKSYNRHEAAGYITNSSCKRDYLGDYANDECDYNGPNTNQPSLKRGQINGSSCDDGTQLYNINPVTPLYYKSTDLKHVVGGKIIGKYPELLVSSTMSQSWTTLDEQLYGNNNSNNNNISLPNFDPSFVGPLPLKTLFADIFTWLKSTDMVGVGDEALNDIFDEGSLYSTFQFMPDSECKVTDVARYSTYTGTLPTITDESNVTREYSCETANSFYVNCKEETYACGDDLDGDGVLDSTCTKTVAGDKNSTDGLPETYYQHLNGSKSCSYIKGETNYKLSIDWVCLPSTESPVKCEVTPEEDDMGNTLYYRCSNISEAEVRSKIVDPIFDAYEANTLTYSNNPYMTPETVKKYIYGIDEEKKKNATGLNPEGYKIDNETREIVTKHIVMEILGAVEGRQAALADANGNFYLQSYNRILNIEQYEDALKETIFIKDDIDDVEENVYSKVIFGTFYNKDNVDKSNIASMTPEQIIETSNRRKESLVQNIIYVYNEIANSIDSREYSSNGSVSGSGLAQADSSGYRVRNSMPYYGSDEYNKYYSSGLYGECAWYALGRVKEILDNAGSSYKWTQNANGADWCNISHTKDFVTTTDYTNPKKGAVISWGGGNGHNYGHVAIIEEVYYDKNGKAVSVDISEGGLNINSSAPQLYSSNYIWKNDTLEIRKKQCATGRCFINRNVPVYMLKNRWSGYYFKCYIYLLKDNDVPEEYGNYTYDQSKDPNFARYSNIKEFLQTSEGVATYNKNGERVNNGNYYKLEGSEGSMISASAYGLMLGNRGDTFTVTDDNGKEYSIKLEDGKLIEKWAVEKYWYQSLIKNQVTPVKEAIKKYNMENIIKKDNEIDALISVAYAFGGWHESIEKLIVEYKNGGYKGMWDYLSTLVYGNGRFEGKPNESILYQAYFHRRDCEFDMFKNGIYKMENPRRFKFYTEKQLKDLGYINSCNLNEDCYVTVSNSTYPNITDSYIKKYYNATFSSNPDYNLSSSIPR